MDGAGAGRGKLRVPWRKAGKNYYSMTVPQSAINNSVFASQYLAGNGPFYDSSETLQNGPYYKIGIDVEMVRMVAAVFDIADEDIEFVDYETELGAGWFGVLGEVSKGNLDMSAWFTTVKAERETLLDVDAVVPYYFDAGTYYTANDTFGASPDVTALQGKTGCLVPKGTSCRAGFDDYIADRGITVIDAGFGSMQNAAEMFAAGNCSFLVAEETVIRGVLMRMSTSRAGTLGPVINMDPLALWVRKDDSAMSDLVKLAFNAVVTASENGLSTTKCDEASGLNMGITKLRRLVQEDYGVGTETTKISAGWASRVICRVGNLRQIFERSLNFDTPIFDYATSYNSANLVTKVGVFISVPAGMML